MSITSEKARMLRGEFYRAADPELVADRERAQQLLTAYHAIVPADAARRFALLRTLFGELGEAAVVQSPFVCDYGYNIRAGRNLFMNYGCVVLDCATVAIGDDVQIGPAVQIYTATHPLDPAPRQAGLEAARPVRIGDTAWIGGGAILLPGVEIGDRAVVGAGSVVTRNVPADAVVAGNPARVIRRLA